MCEYPQNAIRATVIIPAYNAAKTIPVALDSVLAQSESNIEVIVVDDCSTDETRHIATEYAARDTRVRCLAMPCNAGKPIAMNRAASQARGKWLAVLDADDWYAPTRIEDLVNAGEAARVTMVADNQHYYDIHAEQVARTAFESSGTKRIDLDRFLKNSAPLKAFDYGILKPVFLAGFLRRHNIEYAPMARNGHDWYILLDFFAAGGSALLLDKPLYYYVQPYGTISHKWSTNTRKPYPYQQFYNVNCLFVEKYRTKLRKHHQQMLERRGEMFLALAHWQAVKTARHDDGLATAVQTALNAPFVAWKYLPYKIMIKLGRQ